MTEVAKCKAGTDGQFGSVKGSNDEDHEFKTFDSQVFKGVDFCDNVQGSQGSVHSRKASLILDEAKNRAIGA